MVVLQRFVGGSLFAGNYPGARGLLYLGEVGVIGAGRRKFGEDEN